MRRLLFPIILAVSLARGFSSEEFAWVFVWVEWYRYLSEQEPGWAKARYGEEWSSNQIPVPIPLLIEEYPQAAAQLDGLVKVAMKNHHSLDWAFDNLKPSSGPASSVPDSLRRMMLYYIYHDNFFGVERPWSFNGTDIYFFFSDGTGTYDRGWVRYSFLNVSPSMHGEPEFIYMGSCSIAWSKTSDSVMDSARAVRMFNNALQKGMLVSPLSQPSWGTVLGVSADTFHEKYRIPAIEMLVPVEFDCCELYPEEYRKQDTLLVRAFHKNGFEYLTSYSMQYGRLFEPYNFYMTF